MIPINHIVVVKWYLSANTIMTHQIAVSGRKDLQPMTLVPWASFFKTTGTRDNHRFKAQFTCYVWRLQLHPCYGTSRNVGKIVCMACGGLGPRVRRRT